MRALALLFSSVLIATVGCEKKRQPETFEPAAQMDTHERSGGTDWRDDDWGNEDWGRDAPEPEPAAAVVPDEPAAVADEPNELAPAADEPDPPVDEYVDEPEPADQEPVEVETEEPESAEEAEAYEPPADDDYDDAPPADEYDDSEY